MGRISEFVRELIAHTPFTFDIGFSVSHWEINDCEVAHTFGSLMARRVTLARRKVFSRRSVWVRRSAARASTYAVGDE